MNKKGVLYSKFEIPRELKTMKEIIAFHKNFALYVLNLKGNLGIQTAICRGKTIETFIPILKENDREFVRMFLDSIDLDKCDWAITITENYFCRLDKNDKKSIEEFKVHGDLKKHFEDGDKRVKEGVTLQVYTKTGAKLVRWTIVRKGDSIRLVNEIVADIKNVCGYLVKDGLSSKKEAKLWKETDRKKPTLP